MPMDDQVVPSQHSTSEPMVALTGDLSTGRQLRKSCRFCRSRKIRCSGETDIGCSACRNRNQKCIYEPTAAMGRPRKYPRTELYGNVNASLPANLTSSASTAIFERGWSDSRFLMRSLHSQGYEPGQLFPPASVEPTTSPWRPLGEEFTPDTTFHMVSSLNTYPNRPAISHLSTLPPILDPQNIPAIPKRCGSNCGFVDRLDRFIPVSDSGRHSSSSITSHQGLTSQAGLQGCVATNSNHASFSSRRNSPELNQMYHLSINTAAGSLVTAAQPNSQSSPSYDNNALVNTHNIISTCDPAIIFQYFQGATLHTVTQAHLQFILQESPNPYVSAPHKHPSILEPKLYHTMVADVISLITCAPKSTSNRQDSPFHENEFLFTQMLDCDRGENSFQESTAISEGGISPLEQLSQEELNSIYLQWLHINPFGFLFNDTVFSHQSSHYCEDPALLATVVGWHFYLSLQKLNYESVEVVNRDQQKMTLRASMPFFEYAEAELMRRTMSVNELTLTTVRGLTLLAAFRSADSQPRRCWALLSVAHLLTKKYLTTFGAQSNFTRSKGEFDCQKEKMIGLHWLLNLYRSWTLLSMGFPKAKVYALVDGSPSYLESYLTHSQSISATGHAQVNQEWANRMLLGASQMLEVFCTMCIEDPSTLFLQDATAKSISNDQMSERKLGLIRWLMDSAKMKFKVMGIHDSLPSHAHGETYHFDHQIRCSHSSMVFAVVCSLLALSQLVPPEEITSAQFTKIPVLVIRDVLKLLQIISSEGINPVVLVSSGFSMPRSNTLDEALMLGILRRIFRYMTILLQAFVNSLSDFSRTSPSDYSQIVTQFLEVIESLERFASSGLSSHPMEDFQKFENVRITLGSLSNILSICQQTDSNQRQPNLQARLPISVFEPAHDISEPPQPTHNFSHKSFKIKEECVESKIRPIPINVYPGESNRLMNSYSAPTTASSTESTSTCNNEGHLTYLPTSTDVGCLSSSPLLPVSDRTSSVAHLVQKYNYPDPKVEHSIMTSQASEFICPPPSNIHGTVVAGEIEGEEVKCGVLRCPRGQGHYFCGLDSSWMPQPPHQFDLDSHPQPINFDSFPRSSTLMPPVSPPAGSPPSYKYHSPSIDDYYSRNSELREPSSGYFFPSDPPSRVFRTPVMTDESTVLELSALGTHLDTSATSTPCSHTHKSNF